MMTSNARVHMVDLMEMPYRSNGQTVCALIPGKCLKTGVEDSIHLLTFLSY